ncbi:snRNA-activating protein complex subunit 1 [Fasciola hepatica]|uniref:snRNA-activating protein complex subunit 1 n=1 Tax=Fasciola hepatica TaxID=6192 RepID=A0A4E0RZ42_FASHE|nr:snRNA-activating protein complex subunit 1 [Fasciola hepatica]
MEQANKNRSTTKEDRVYAFRSIFNPVRGVDEDITEFISRFTACGSLRFTKFSELWRREKFIEIIYGRRHQAGLYDILGCIYHRLIDVILPETGKKQIERICALYMLYAFYGKQPVKNHVRIRVCPDSWKALLQLSTDARDEGHLDVYFVFRRLFALGAFLFCATRQMLYPGVPLFDSPQTTQVPLKDFGPTTMIKERNRRKLRVGEQANQPLSTYWQAFALPSTSRVPLNEALKSLDASLMRYTEAKGALNPPRKDAVINIVKTEWREGSNDEDSDEAEEFLPGLNFITYPGCLNKVLNTLKKLDDLEHEHESPKTEPTEGPVESAAHRCTDDSQNYQVFPDLMLETVPPEDPVTDQITESCSNFTPRKRPTNKRKLQTSNLTGSVCMSLSDGEVSDIGERRRLLRQPVTWSSELSAQSAAVRMHGHHHNRRRPTQRKVLKRRTSSQRRIKS